MGAHKSDSDRLVQHGFTFFYDVFKLPLGRGFVTKSLPWNFFIFCGLVICCGMYKYTTKRLCCNYSAGQNEYFEINIVTNGNSLEN